MTLPTKVLDYEVLVRILRVVRRHCEGDSTEANPRERGTQIMRALRVTAGTATPPVPRMRGAEM